MDKKSIVAIFDFDGTLTRKSTTLAFLHYKLGKKFYLYYICLVPVLVLYIFKLITIDKLNYLLCTICMKGYLREYLINNNDFFFRDHIKPNLRNAAIKRLKWHQANGHRCILATSAYDIYIREWGHLFKFDHVLSTRIEFDKNNKATGKIDGKSCSGKEKLRRIKEVVDKSNSIIYAYGDSDGDKEMLDFADYPFYRSFY